MKVSCDLFFQIPSMYNPSGAQDLKAGLFYNTVRLKPAKGLQPRPVSLSSRRCLPDQAGIWPHSAHAHQDTNVTKVCTQETGSRVQILTVATGDV